MIQQAENLSITDIINGLYETIWTISNSIGVSLEVSHGRIPQQNIDPSELANRLLVDGLAQVGRNLELLRTLEENIKKRDTMEVGQNIKSRTHKGADKK